MKNVNKRSFMFLIVFVCFNVLNNMNKFDLIILINNIISCYGILK